MEQENARYKKELEKQKNEITYKLTNNKDEIQEELNQIRKLQYKIQAELPDIKSKAENIKKALEIDMNINDKQYSKLKSLDNDQLSLIDIMSIKIYEAILKHKKDAGRAEEESKITKEKLLIIEEKLSNTENELNRLKHKYDTSIGDYVKRINDYINKDKFNQAEITELHIQLKEMGEKVKKYEETSGELKDIVMKQKIMKERLVEKKSENERLVKDMNEHNILIKKLNKEITILKENQEYLQKESSVLNEKNKRLETKNELLTQELKKHRTIPHLDIKNYNESQHESIHITEPKNKHKEDFNNTEIYKEQILLLMESKEEYKQKVTIIKQQLNDKEKHYDDLLFDHCELKRKLEEDRATLEMALNFKEQEVAKLSSELEEYIEQYKKAQIEAHTTSDKVVFLKAECYRLEVAYNQLKSDMAAENALLRERLKAYEYLEQELNQIVLQTAKDQRFNIDNETSNGPLNVKKRMEQSLVLTSQLLARKTEIETANKILKEKEEKYKEQAIEMKKLKHLANKTSQPFLYLNNKLEKTEEELLLSTKENKKNNSKIKEMSKEIELLKEVII